MVGVADWVLLVTTEDIAEIFRTTNGFGANGANSGTKGGNKAAVFNPGNCTGSNPHQ
jgi:hypothetical protein